MTPESMREFLSHYSGVLRGRCTFFVHDQFPELFSTLHEICAHPFIGDLTDWERDLRRLAEFLPEAPKGVRPHSCVFSHMIGVGLKALGYTYVSQAQNLYQTDLRPFRHPWGIWELPIYYMDNMDFWMGRNWPSLGHQPFSESVIDKAVSGKALFVFDLHPIHIALNTRSPDDYSSVKEEIIKDGTSPFQLRFPGEGAGHFFEKLCDRMRAADVVSLSCSDALRVLGCHP